MIYISRYPAVGKRDIQYLKIPTGLYIMGLVQSLSAETIEECDDNPHPLHSVDHLITFASNVIHLDQSRKAFFAQHHYLIVDLVNGKLVGRNRFRQMLLGDKGTGKSTLLQILQKYIAHYYRDVVIILHNYSTKHSQIRIVDLLQLQLQRQHPSLCREYNSCFDRSDQIYKQVRNIENMLIKHKLKVMILRDDFDYVYRLDRHIGAVITTEVAIWSGTQEGTMHMIVSGCDKILPNLAFNQIEGLDMSIYPSYGGLDLNNTKLQPRYIDRL